MHAAADAGRLRSSPEPPSSSLQSPLISHLSSAGYNNLEVAEYLLEHGADVNAQDKGGLIPLHNAASYGVRCSHACFQGSSAYLRLSFFHSSCPWS